MIDRRLVQYFDWGMLTLTFLVCSMGMVALYSAVNAGTATAQAGLFAKQLIWFGVGTAAMVIAFLFDYKSYEKWAYLFYGLCILLLLGVLFFGKYVGGSRRWLAVGPVSIQPSEIVKLAVIFVLAKYYARVCSTKGITARELVTPVILTAIPFMLVVQQPDLGTAMVIALIAGAITLFAKIERRTFICISVAGALAVPLVWLLLKGYQKQRILTFLNPDRDPLGAGYHIIQSKIAVGVLFR